MQFTPCKRRFDQVGRIHCAIGFPGTDKGMHFINEQNNFACGIRDFVQDRFQTFFEFATILCTCDQGPHVQGHQPFVAQ